MNNLGVSSTAQHTAEGFSVKLLRRENDMSWVEYLDACLVVVSSFSIIIRNSVTEALTADITKAAVSCIDEMSPSLFRIQTTTGLTVALQFFDESCGKMFKSAILSQLKIVCAVKSLGTESTDEELIPDLKDPAVQEHIVRLLFSEDFETFTQDIDSFLDELMSSF